LKFAFSRPKRSGSGFAREKSRACVAALLMICPLLAPTGFAATLVVTSLFESRLRAWWRGGRMQSPVAAGVQ